MKYATYAHYQYANYDRFELVSLHKTYELAEKRARDNSFLGIAPVSNNAKRGRLVGNYAV